MKRSRQNWCHLNFPRGKAQKFSSLFANWYSLNEFGEMTGPTWVTESDFLETPIRITNSVGVVRDAVLKWYVETDWYKGEDWWYTYPVVAETYDGFLSDIYGFHVKEEHVLEAITNASTLSCYCTNLFSLFNWLQRKHQKFLKA